MALKNRVEVGQAVQDQVAVVSENEYKELLDTNFAKNVLYRKDVKVTDNAAAAAKTLEFLDIDYIEVTQTNAAVAYTLNNVQQGEVKYLKIAKPPGNTISFANANNQAFDQGRLNTLTEVFYKIINKDGANLLVIPLILDIGIATALEARGIVDDTKVMTPKKVGSITSDTIWSEFEIEDWNMDGVSTLSVSIGAIDPDDVREVSVIIRIDDDDVLAPRTYNLEQAGDYFVRGGNLITLNRDVAGIFDSSSFNKTSFNRGWVSIRHKI